MKVELVGYREVEFDTRDGAHIEGYSLFVSYEDDNVKGKAVDKIFISRDKANKMVYYPNVGEFLNLTYNKYGKVEEIKVSK